MNKINKVMAVCGLGLAVGLQSCDLDEVNPSDFSLETLTYSPEGMEPLINNCYFGLERVFYNAVDFMDFMEGNTDIWTNAANTLGSNNTYFKFFGGATPDITFTNTFWNAAYDGIASCNIVIANADNAVYPTQEAHDAKIAEAYFLRGVYYYHLAEMFGGVVKLTEPQQNINYAPERVEPIELYRDLIIPDFRYAAAHLPLIQGGAAYADNGNPTRKAALGFLAKACLATSQYGTTEFLQEGFNAAKDLIADCEAGGATYHTYMYSDFDDIFASANNLNNKEALWKYNIYAGKDAHGSSNGNYRTNRNDQHFCCNITRFAAREDTEAARLLWDWNTNEGGSGGDFMPTQYLLSLYVEADGSLDPRFHKLFMTEWDANKAYKWTDGDIKNYGKSASLKDNPIAVGEKAIKFVMPQDADYATEVANKPTSNYVLVDYKDVYKDADRSIIMTSGDGENMFRYFYPSLIKHNCDNYYQANASKKRNGNLNAVFAMRMAEVYLMAAEYDILLNGGGNAMGYINKVRTRAGAKPLAGGATIRTVLDERARELCGEFTRFFDLKRTGMFKDKSYLQETHPELAGYFKPEYALRPIPQQYTNIIANGAEFQNPGYSSGE